MTKAENESKKEGDDKAKWMVIGAIVALVLFVFVLFAVMLVGVIMWQLGIFNDGMMTVTSTGFSKIKPQLAGTSVTKEGQFNGIFTNGVGTSIKIKSVEVADTSKPSYSCSLTPGMFTPNELSAGDNMRITSPEGCVSPGNPDDVYQVKVSIEYEVNIGGVTTKHVEYGNIRGPYE